jgi:molybdate transport system substrate-binding protein
MALAVPAGLPIRRISATALALGLGMAFGIGLGGLAWVGARQAVVAKESPLLISAAISLSEPLQALAPFFARQQKLPLPAFNFGSSGALKQQIAKGAPVDVFIAAADKPMQQLQQLGLLLPGSRRVLASNRLVLVVPARSPRQPLGFAGLASVTIRRIAIGDSSVPAGDYARQTLAHYQLTDALQAKLVPMGSVRAVAHAVAHGDVDAGIVYESDAHNVANLRITAIAPQRGHAPIRYSGAVIKGSRQPQQALAYLRSLSSPTAQQTYRRFGLQVPTAIAPGAGP